MSKSNKNTPPKLGRSPFIEDTIYKSQTTETENQTLPPEQENQKKRKGRPREHTEGWTKATVVLLDKHIDWLDQLSVDMRKTTKTSISRAELIRAILQAIIDNKMHEEFTDIYSAEQITTKISNKLKRN